MIQMPSDFVGTERQIDLVGRFDCECEVTKQRKKDDTATDREVICKLIVPNGYHFKVGFMASFDSDEKPDMEIISVEKYTSHTVCELVSVK